MSATFKPIDMWVIQSASGIVRWQRYSSEALAKRWAKKFDERHPRQSPHLAFRVALMVENHHA